MTSPSHADLLREYLEQLSQPGAESRLPKWTDWLKLRVGGVMALGALALTACDDSGDGQGNQGGAAGMAQTSAGGALSTMSAVAVYAAPMTGGTGAAPATGTGGTGAGPAVNNGGTGNVFNVTSPVAEYMAPMPTGGSANIATKYGVPMNTGGTTNTNIATKYGVPMSTGGSTNIATKYGVPMNMGGTPIYAAPMEKGGATASGGSSAKTTTTSTLPGMRYAAPMGGRSSTTAPNPTQSTGGTDMAALYMVVMDSGFRRHTGDASLVNIRHPIGFGIVRGW
ncbi:MAG TPA: hypothetical protein VKP30_23145 [Polyangiaceae bacterium]|nr:hypothetical protein [Polyangiaceae bacterium]